MPKSNNFLTVLADPKDAQIDIIAVHGLNYTDRENHAELSWTAPNGKMWLKDPEFLPSKIPNARILLFGYNANVAFRASTAGVDQQAGNLLNRLHLLRMKREAKGVPIMFICYSLGGIIVKRALVIAKNDSTYTSIGQSSYGLVFFGTPHQGGNFANLGHIAESIARISLQYPGNTLIEALAKDSLFADIMIKDFRHQLEDRWVVTFYETHPIENLGIIVDQKSATLGLPGPREIQVALDTDHENLCRFADCGGHDFEQVGENIQELAQKVIAVASKVAAQNITKSKNQPMKISTLPDLLHQHFTGRERQLQQLHEIIAKPSSKPKRVSIYGMPGVGKSQLALKFAYQNQSVYKNIFYVQATDETQLFQDFDTIHSLLQLPKRLISERNLKIQDILQWLVNSQDDNDWLIIFDNVLDVNMIKKFLPATGTGVILFTMRSEHIAEELGSAGRIELLSMEEAEGVKLILKIAGVSNPLSSEYLGFQKAATEIHRELGGLPLALTQGISYSKHNCWSISQYLDKLQSAEKIEVLRKETLFGSKISLYSNCYSTFSIAIHGITPTAVMLLKIISYLNHQDVPFQLFEDGRQDLSNFLDSFSIGSWKTQLKALWSGDLQYRGSRSLVKGNTCDGSINLIRKLFFGDNELEKAILCLQTSALIRRKDEGNIWMHDLFCDLSQHLVSPLEKNLVVASAIVLARGPLQITDNGRMGMGEAIASHLIKSLKNAQEIESFMVNHAAFRLAYYYQQRGQYRESLELYQRVLPRYEKALGKRYPDTLGVVNNIAILYSKQGEYSRALEWYQRALAGHKLILGKNHPSTLDAIYNIAIAYSKKGEYDIALEWYQRALAGYEKTLGKEDPSVLDVINGMATLFAQRREDNKALEYYQRALVALEKSLGEEHLGTLNAVYGIAMVFATQGNYDKALEWYQRALAGYEKVLGKEHSETLILVVRMAGVLNEQGKHGKALEWYQRALAGCEKALGDEHPHTLSTICSMAAVFVGQERYGKALECIQRALAGYEKTLGKEHPQTLSTILVMATVFTSQGKDDEALEWYQRTLAGCEKALGNKHPKTLSAVYEIATVFANQGKDDEALEWYQRALAGCEKAFGNEHIHTLRAASGIAKIFNKQGKHDEALKWCRHALVGYEKALGSEHPYTLDEVFFVGTILLSQGKNEEALEWYQSTLARYEKTLGNEHPQTLNVVYGTARLFIIQGKEEEALKLYQRVLDGCEKSLGDEHTLILNTAFEMATTFKNQGKDDKALEGYLRALVGYEKTLRKTHPLTLEVAGYVEELYTKKRCFEEAAAIRQKFGLSLSPPPIP